MEIETKASKILRVISDAAKTMHIIDFVTLAVWIAGAFLIKAVTNIGDSVPSEMRLMYVMFIIVYMLFMLVFLCLAEIVHTIKRIEQR